MICSRYSVVIYNNDYVKTLSRLNINKEIVNKNFDKFLKEYSLDNLKSKNAWWNMIEIEDPKNILVNVNIAEHMSNSIMVVTLFPRQSVNAHIDFSDNYAAINIPFANCNDQTVTHFYEHPDNQTRFVCRDDFKLGARQLIDIDKLINTFSFSLTKYSVLFRPDKPHSISNNGDKVRIMLSWRFKPEYSWDQAVELCKNYHLM